jgi:hypothetical protein
VTVISEFGIRNLECLPPTRVAICEARARPPEVPGIPIRSGAQQGLHRTSANRRAWHPLGEGAERKAPRCQQGGEEFRTPNSEFGSHATGAMR